MAPKSGAPAEAESAAPVRAAATTTRAYATASPTSDLGPFSIERRAVGPRDVQIEILYCGICHSDLHQARNEWGDTTYPCVPGHEIVGRVTKVGGTVTRFREGDVAGVGCLVDSCRTCTNCRDGLEQFCEHGATFTYNSPDPHTGGVTYGGYSERVVVDEAFVLRIPDASNLPGVAPLLCAGITTYSPLRHWGVTKGTRVAVVGLGGLGHVALKLARAFEAEVVLFTTSPGKVAAGLRLGANEVVLSTDTDALAAQADRFDFILDTVSAPHDINALLTMLRRDGTLTLVGAPEKPLAVEPFNVIFGRRRFAGSLIGGIRETQEMLDFCAAHDITADAEVIAIQDVNRSYERLLKNDVKYRFVIDMATMA